MKSETEIYKAHDMLLAVILKEIPMVVGKNELQFLQLQASSLCWVLGHDHNRSLNLTLEQIEKFVAHAGFVVTEHARPIYADGTPMAEAKLGRFLRREEVVHHRNGIDSDDRYENLLVTTQSEHIRIERHKMKTPEWWAGVLRRPRNKKGQFACS